MGVMAKSLNRYHCVLETPCKDNNILIFDKGIFSAGK